MPANPLIGTYTHIPLPKDGYYEIKSMLVPHTGTILPGEGMKALNKLVYDPIAAAVVRVTGFEEWGIVVVSEQRTVVNADGTTSIIPAVEEMHYTYLFEAVDNWEDAVILADYPVFVLTALSVYDWLHTKEELLVKMLSKQLNHTCSCSSAHKRTASRNGTSCCGNGCSEKAERLHRDLALHLSGAESGYRYSLKGLVLKNLCRIPELICEINEELSDC